MSFASRLQRLGVWCVTLALAVAVSGCTPGAGAADTGSSAGPDRALADTIGRFVADWQAGRTHDAARLTTDPAAAALLLTTIGADLGATRLTIDTSEPVAQADGDERVTATMTWSLPIVGTWQYDVPWTFTRQRDGDGEQWRLKYSPAVVHPDLGPQRTLVVRRTPARDGSIVDRHDAELISAVRVYSVVVLVDKVSDVSAVAASLADAVGRFDKTLTAKSIAKAITDARRAGHDSYTVVNLREKDFQSVQASLAKIGPLSLPSTVRKLPPSPDFAATVLDQAVPVAEKMIKGKPGWRIATVDAAGDELETLDEQPPVPGPKVTITLDRQVQQAAQHAVDPIKEPTVLVAIQPSTGEVLAVAQNEAAAAQGPIALTGQYPPGSIFKIVTATAAIDRGLITSQTEVGCPGSILIGSHRIHNEGFELGTVTATTAFAHSCNTSFAELGTQMPPDALPKTARQFGIGLDFDMTGLVTLTGSVERADSISARAQNGFGQGTDLVTPFSAALMAATVAAGQMPTPVVIRGTPTTVDHAAPKRRPKAVRGLRTMMRAVVTDGTATDLADAGDVHAKTGTAEYVDAAGDIQAHAWTVGYRNDLAFAALIVGGNSSHRTNGLLDGFLQGLPAAR